MKKLLLVLVMLVGFGLQAQVNDFELVNMLIGKKISQLDSIVSLSGYDYTFTKEEYGDNYESELYIETQFGGIKLWKLSGIIETESGNPQYIKKEDGTLVFVGRAPSTLITITKIFVRYRHCNVGDLKDFKSYPYPIDNDTIEYEKQMGERMSHLKVNLK